MVAGEHCIENSPCCERPPGQGYAGAVHVKGYAGVVQVKGYTQGFIVGILWYLINTTNCTVTLKREARTWGSVGTMFARIERGTSAELFHGLNGKTNGIRGGFTVRMSNSCDLGWPPSFTNLVYSVDLFS